MRSTGVLALVGCLLCSAPAASPAATTRDLGSIDWSLLVRALRVAFSNWRFYPLPHPTPTPPLTPTSPPVATATPASTETPTSVPTRTATATRTNTARNTSTATRTRTRTPRPTATRVSEGQIAFGTAPGIPPAQKLASALVAFPYIEASVDSGGTMETRIELINLSTSDQSLQCFYIRESDCNEIGFFVSLTAEQPLVWLASEGASNPLTFSAVPPFDGVGELKCAVVPRLPGVENHNVLQGRAVVFDTSTGETVGYGAIGFQRLVPGTFDGVVDLDGGTYESCPDRLHFQVLAPETVSSDLVLVPCAQDLLFQVPTKTAVQVAIVNEFEQVFSSAFRFKCHTMLPLSRVSSTLSRAVIGTDTAHLVVRGVDSPLIGVVIDRFDALGQRQTAVNEPYLEGGRASTVIFP